MAGYLTWLLNGCVPYANQAGRPWKNLGRAERSCSIKKGAAREKGTDSSAKSVVIGQGKEFQTERGEV